MKATVIIQFRGADFSQLFEKGKTYDFEQKRAEALAARGLVEILSEKAAETKVETPSPKTEEVVKVATETKTEEVATAEEAPKRGRKKAE